MAGARLARRRDDHHHGRADADSSYVDRGLSLVDAIAAPRLSSRNGKAEDAEPALLRLAGRRGAAGEGPRARRAQRCRRRSARSPRSAPTARHAFQAAAEPVRRGGGSAMVVHRSQPLSSTLKRARARRRATENWPGNLPASSASSQRCSESEPRFFCTTRYAAPPAASRGSQCSSRSCSAALPTRIGGLDQIASNRRSSGTPSGVAGVEVRPVPAWRALCRARSSARCVDVDRPDRGAGRRAGQASGRSAPSRSRGRAAAPVAGGGGACAAAPRCRRRRRSGLKTPGRGLHARPGARPA